MNSENIGDFFSYLFSSREYVAEFPDTLKKDWSNEYESFEVLADARTCQIIVDQKHFWNVEEIEEDVSTVSFNTKDETVKNSDTVKLSKYFAVSNLIQFYLIHPGTTIQFLNIVNHPSGLDSCRDLKVHHLKWNLAINSSRYDYTTWFRGLRKHPIDIIEMDINGTDNMILSEIPVVYATKLRIKTRIQLPIQAIMSFDSSEFRLEQPLCFQELFMLCNKWIVERKTVGTKFIMNLANKEYFTLIRQYFCQIFIENFVPLENAVGFLLRTNFGINIEITDLNGEEVLMEVV